MDPVIFRQQIDIFHAENDPMIGHCAGYWQAAPDVLRSNLEADIGPNLLGVFEHAARHVR
jgi:hypothetical protein